MSIIFILIKIFSTIFYSLVDVFAKYLFLYNYISLYTLLLFKSIYIFVYLIIFSLPFIFIKLRDEKGEPESIFIIINNIFDDKKYILIVIGYIITSCLYNISIFLIIDIFSPNHFIASQILSDFVIFLINLAVKGIDSQDNIIIRIIMYILIMLSSLIFNEFIIINICGLAKSKQIMKLHSKENH